MAARSMREQAGGGAAASRDGPLQKNRGFFAAVFLPESDAAGSVRFGGQETPSCCRGHDDNGVTGGKGAGVTEQAWVFRDGAGENFCRPTRQACRKGDRLSPNAPAAAV